MARTPLAPTELIPNRALLNAINEWKKSDEEGLYSDLIEALKKERPEFDTDEDAQAALKHVDRKQLEHVICQRKVFDFLIELCFEILLFLPAIHFTYFSNLCAYDIIYTSVVFGSA